MSKCSPSSSLTVIISHPTVRSLVSAPHPNPSWESDNDHDESALNHVLYDITEAHLLRTDDFIAQT